MALILFYFKEEPTDFDRIAKLWACLEFVLEFKGEFKKQLVTLG